MAIFLKGKSSLIDISNCITRIKLIENRHMQSYIKVSALIEVRNRYSSTAPGCWTCFVKRDMVTENEAEMMIEMIASRINGQHNSRVNVVIDLPKMLQSIRDDSSEGPIFEEEADL